MNTSFSTKYFQRLKGSLLVDLRLPWQGTSLEGVNMTVFQHFKAHYNKYLNDKHEASATRQLIAFADYVLHDMSRLPTIAEVHKEAFECMRVNLLSSSCIIVERTVKAFDYLIQHSNDILVYHAISQRLIMKTISIVGRRQHEQGNHNLSSMIFMAIKFWAMMFEHQQEKYPYFWGTYMNLRDKHGITIPDRLLKHHSKQSIRSSSKSSSLSPKLLVKLAGNGTSSLFTSNGDICQTLSVSDDDLEHDDDSMMDGDTLSETSYTMMDFDECSIEFPLPFGENRSQHHLQSRIHTPSDIESDVEDYLKGENIIYASDDVHHMNDESFLSPDLLSYRDTCISTSPHHDPMVIISSSNDGKISHHSSWVTTGTCSESSTPTKDNRNFNSSFGSYESTGDRNDRASQNFDMPDIYVDPDLLVSDIMSSMLYSNGVSMKVHTEVEAIPEESECDHEYEMGSTFYSIDHSIISAFSTPTSPHSHSVYDDYDTDDDTVFRYLNNYDSASENIIMLQLTSLPLPSGGVSVSPSPVGTPSSYMKVKLSPRQEIIQSIQASVLNSRIPKAIARRRSFTTAHHQPHVVNADIHTCTTSAHNNNSEDDDKMSNKSTSDLDELQCRVLRRKGSKIPQLKKARRCNSMMSIISETTVSDHHNHHRNHQKAKPNHIGAYNNCQAKHIHRHDPSKDILSHTASSQAKVSATAKIASHKKSVAGNTAMATTATATRSSSNSRSSKHNNSSIPIHHQEKHRPYAIWL